MSDTPNTLVDFYKRKLETAHQRADVMLKALEQIRWGDPSARLIRIIIDEAFARIDEIDDAESTATLKRLGELMSS